jgi:dihydroxyacid dehydratase/phosphogluconate dehydratase
MSRLRSQDRFGGTDVSGFAARSWMKNQGLADRDFDGRPVIGICNTYSELTPCNAHFRELAEHVKRGVREAGGPGPRGYPGMPEVGNLPLPKALLRRGIADLVRISDARMSGTAFGTVVLHVAPESAAGGPLALVEDGDMIELDVTVRRLHLDVDDAELQRRRATWTAPEPVASSGYQKLYVDHVLQADRGVDFDFLLGRRGTEVTGDNH